MISERDEFDGNTHQRKLLEQALPVISGVAGIESIFVPKALGQFEYSVDLYVVAKGNDTRQNVHDVAVRELLIANLPFDNGELWMGCWPANSGVHLLVYDEGLLSELPGAKKMIEDSIKVFPEKSPNSSSVQG